MWHGYVALGTRTFQDPNAFGGFELINNSRLMANIRTWNNAADAGLVEPMRPIHVVSDCDECPGTERFFSQPNLAFLDRLGYCGVWTDPAPWYDGDVDGDSARFLGVMGLDAKGIYSGLRDADIRRTVNGDGYVGRLLRKPRTIIIRGLAIAVNHSGMMYGLDWLRQQTRGLEAQLGDPDCEGDTLWFLDSCPECVAQSVVDEPCEYPPATVVPPDECLYPYLRGYRRCRVIEGPVVDEVVKLPGCGAYMTEFELVIIAPDGVKITDPFDITGAQI